ncbi:MAG: aminopeptidase P family protein [Oscillospiraceae bacterium]|nr:aminopeptidase P family protein [Oscillospiraceae bacterium]
MQELLKTPAQRLEALRRLMAERGMIGYLVPTGDDHASEYTGEHFACRAWLTGFTGSAGTAAVTAEAAGLWTDGRYFLQAEEQLAGSGFELFRMGEPGVPTPEQWLAEHMPPCGRLGVDGQVLTAREARRIEEVLTEGQELFVCCNLVGKLWKDRPALSCEPVWEQPAALAGRTRAEKLADIRQIMAKKGADALLLPALDDVAWLLNLRGSDVAYNPVALAFAAVEQERAVLFVQEKAICPALRERLAADGVEVDEYMAAYDYAESLPEDAVLWLDPAQANVLLWDSAPDEMYLLEEPSPVQAAKAVKNPVEQDGMRAAHKKDGAALCKFLYRLKQTVGREPLTELSAAAMLEALRAQQPGYLGPSFETIAGYGPHGAIVHYAATPESDAPLEARGLLLVDSGGQYAEGTTDVTRTVALGPVTDEERAMFTLVLRCHLALGGAKFRRGVTGHGLDAIARAPMWAEGLDYNHGTGHGVGCLLNVHEGPVRVGWRGATVEFEPGMVTSNEPGFYKAGAFGVRTENLMLCRAAGGDFLEFEPLTLAPIDRDAIDPEALSAREKAQLNAYHARVYREIAPLLTEDEAAWLREATREIG